MLDKLLKFNKANPEKDSNRFIWIEWIKAIALIWIFLNHASERIFGFPWIANPSIYWPPLAERISQLSPLSGYGLGNIFVNLFRYVGWFGDQGVQLFIILSGFGLTWGLLSKGYQGGLSLRSFYSRRLGRIYPLWWGVHFLFAAVWLFTGKGLDFTSIEAILSLLGIRVTPAAFYYFAPAWWYFTLILQLYLVYPLLWIGMRALGTQRFLVITSAIAFTIRFVGLQVFTDYLDVWQRGGIFITRLPEFVFGMALAAWMAVDRQKFEEKLTSMQTIGVGIVSYVVGLVLSLSLVGMTFGPFLTGVGAFLILFNIITFISKKTPQKLATIGIWIGVHSYSIYLIHHPVINRFIPEETPVAISVIARLAAAAAATALVALILESSVGWVEKKIRDSLTQKGWLISGLRVGSLGVICVVSLFFSEFLVRKFNPQEVNGWGERISLEIDDRFGWRLIPDQTTQLRWESYDYFVTANSLGFPGPAYSSEKPDGVYRILITGDAFSSAEGVNTDQAWPSILEADLSQQLGMPVQVLNFAITGYGPNQYRAIIDEYVPVFRPDLVIVEFFVNDFQDVELTNEQFQYSIGFFEPSQTGLASYIRLEHLRSFLRYDILDRLSEFVTNQPQTTGYFLGNFNAFETWRKEAMQEASHEVEVQLENIKRISAESGSKLMTVVVPASIQVCQPKDLAYYPMHVDFSDPELYDPEMPQRLFRQMNENLDIPIVDLRIVFEHASGCPYQPKNMHWTESGHKAVADYLANYLIQEKINGAIP